MWHCKCFRSLDICVLHRTEEICKTFCRANSNECNDGSTHLKGCRGESSTSLCQNHQPVPQLQVPEAIEFQYGLWFSYLAGKLSHAQSSWPFLLHLLDKFPNPTCLPADLLAAGTGKLPSVPPQNTPLPRTMGSLVRLRALGQGKWVEQLLN